MEYAPVGLPDTPPGGVTAGIDWASADHAVCIVDAAGEAVSRFTVAHTAEGLGTVVSRLAKAGAREVAIERGDGPVVDALLAAGVTLVVITPRQIRTCGPGMGRRVIRTTGSTRMCSRTSCAPTGPGCGR
jgi:transposase